MKFDAINYPNGKIEIPPFIEEEGTFDVILIERCGAKGQTLYVSFKKKTEQCLVQLHGEEGSITIRNITLQENQI